MADPSVAAPAGVAVSGQDLLLATKLHVPRPQPGFVPRRRLVEALGESLARGRVLVCAPARHETRLRPWHVQLGRQQEILPGHGNARRGRHRRVSHL